jgi:hypothetical protein
MLPAVTGSRQIWCNPMTVITTSKKLKHTKTRTMKKLLLAITASTAMILSASNSIFAQSNGNIASANTGKKSIANAETGGENESLSNSAKSKKSAKAFKAFSRQFKNVSNAEWEMTNTGAFVASFHEEKANTKVYYNENGGYICTIRRYAESELPQSVRHMVKSTYYDYAIIGVDEVQSEATVYLVHIVFGNNCKTIRVVDGEMDVFEDLTKQ